MTEIAIAVVMVSAFIWFARWMVRWQFARADERLHEWAAKQHYQVLDKERANTMGTGPMTRSGNKQVMYRVTLSDANGAKRRALLKIGSKTMGVTSDELVVEWEDGAA